MIKMDLENEKDARTEDAAAVEETKENEATENASEETFSSELAAPRWSVVSFETRIASHLTYIEAAEKLKQLTAAKIAGLCIITDEAADRIKN